MSGSFSQSVVGRALSCPATWSWMCWGAGSGRDGLDDPWVSAGGDTHRAGGALDDLHRGLDVVGVQVRHLGRGDLAHLVLGQLADLLLVRDARTLLQAGGLLDELRGRRGLG